MQQMTYRGKNTVYIKSEITFLNEQIVYADKHN